MHVFKGLKPATVSWYSYDKFLELPDTEGAGGYRIINIQIKYVIAADEVVYLVVNSPTPNSLINNLSFIIR